MIQYIKCPNNLFGDQTIQMLHSIRNTLDILPVYDILHSAFPSNL